MQQQRFLSTYENITPQFTYAQIPPVVPQIPPVVPQIPPVVPQIPPVVPQMPVMPIAGVPTGGSAYLPVGGLQPMYTSYPAAIAPPGVTHVVPSVTMPSLSVRPQPSAVAADNTTRL